MTPKIQHTRFGAITIDGQEYSHDVPIRLDGQVEKRKKKLSKAVYGTSHKISLDEAQYIHQEGAARLILGTGQFGLVKLSDQAAAFFDEMGCQVEALPTPEALKSWNQAEDGVIAVFHITC